MGLIVFAIVVYYVSRDMAVTKKHEKEAEAELLVNRRQIFRSIPGHESMSEASWQHDYNALSHLTTEYNQRLGSEEAEALNKSRLRPQLETLWDNYRQRYGVDFR